MKFLKTIPTFPVHNIDKAVIFYETKFGFTCRHKDGGFAILIRDSIELHLWLANDNTWKIWGPLLFLKPIHSGAESYLAGTHSCRIEVEGIDGLYEELKNTNVLHHRSTVVEATAWGTREFAAIDLHGNLITFFESV
jgi:catechol 2,3-dioxygenase-like lactoylglutathione lyase family enzyme